MIVNTIELKNKLNPYFANTALYQLIQNLPDDKQYNFVCETYRNITINYNSFKIIFTVNNEEYVCNIYGQNELSILKLFSKIKLVNKDIKSINYDIDSNMIAYKYKISKYYYTKIYIMSPNKIIAAIKDNKILSCCKCRMIISDTDLMCIRKEIHTDVIYLYVIVPTHIDEHHRYRSYSLVDMFPNLQILTHEKRVNIYYDTTRLKYYEKTNAYCDSRIANKLFKELCSVSTKAACT